MRPNAVRTTLALALLGSLSVSCGSAPPTSDPTGVDELVIPTPSPDPADFADRIDNEFLPLVPGNTWVYRSSQGTQSVTTVLDEPRLVAGVSTTVVHGVVEDAEGRVLGETYDWFAQDVDGNVWSFGEQGVWEAGVEGALAGLTMPAEPRRGDGYQQEFLPGVAEGRATVLALDATAVVPYGDFEDVLLTEQTSPLEPGLVQQASYAAGVGLVLERAVTGPDEVVELVSFTRG